jgi:hypothetical protein
MLIGIVLFWMGVLAGYLFKSWMNSKFKDYSGTIIVDTDELAEKTVYSLVLDDYPETLVFKKEVVFKIDTSVKSSDRT